MRVVFIVNLMHSPRDIFVVHIQDFQELMKPTLTTCLLAQFFCRYYYFKVQTLEKTKWPKVGCAFSHLIRAIDLVALESRLDISTNPGNHTPTF